MAELRWKKTVGPAEIVKLSVGPMDNNVYLVSVGGDTLLIDGSNEADAILSELGDRKLAQIIQTHSHGDHLIALPELVSKTAAPVYIHPADAAPVPVANQALHEGDDVEIGGVKLEVLHTPGHTPGGLSFVIREGGETHLFSGDTLFPGGPGGTNNDEKLFAQIMDALETKLFVLPDDTYVYPGHGDDTTIGEQRPSVEEWRARGW